MLSPQRTWDFFQLTAWCIFRVFLFSDPSASSPPSSTLLTKKAVKVILENCTDISRADLDLIIKEEDEEDEVATEDDYDPLLDEHQAIQEDADSFAEDTCNLSVPEGNPRKRSYDWCFLSDDDNADNDGNGIISAVNKRMKKAPTKFAGCKHTQTLYLHMIIKK